MAFTGGLIVIASSGSDDGADVGHSGHDIAQWRDGGNHGNDMVVIAMVVMLVVVTMVMMTAKVMHWYDNGSRDACGNNNGLTWWW